MATTEACPICGAQNLPATRSCGTCGAPLGTDPTEAFSGELPVGTKLHGGVYSVGRVLGQGGFGITYLGGDIRSRRPVAIKEFFPYGSTRRGTNVHPFGALGPADFASARDKFLDEARILARFDHPGIVDVYGTFAENNTAYMVMELLRGKSLGQLIAERGGLPEAEAVGYIIQVAEALEVVHRANLLHRDLKPDNIMLIEDGKAVLIDFGTARNFAAGRTGRMTTMVTPGYAPLEQYGERVRFGPFTDVYALGGTLFHALTGQMPPSATDRASGVDLLPPHRVNPAVGAGVSEAVLWAMKMRVNERPQTVREFLGALRSAGVTASPPAPGSTRAGPDDFPEAVPVPFPLPGLPGRPTWRPPLPYDGPYDVEVSGDKLIWPDRCACCLQQPTTHLRIEHTAPSGFLGLSQETKGWNVPYCSPCAEHVRLQDQRPGSGLGGMAFGGLLGGPIGMLIGLGSAAASIIGAVDYYSKLESLLKSTCASAGLAVAYRGWYKTTHAFTFLNRDYADFFLRQNSGTSVT
jgi:serine/threonine protein kinase